MCDSQHMSCIDAYSPRLHNVPTPSFGALDGVYCTGDETRTADDYYSLQDPLGSVVFAAGVSTNEGEGP